MNTSHFPSLELCKKLQNTGLDNTEKVIDDYGNIDDRNLTRVEGDNTPMFPCPSVMELLDEMPLSIEGNTLSISRGCYKGPDIFYITYINDDEYFGEHSIGTLPNALAEMWLWLKENNYLP